MHFNDQILHNEAAYGRRTLDAELQLGHDFCELALPGKFWGWTSFEFLACEAMNHHGDGSVFEQKSMRCQSCRPPSLQTDLLCTRVHAARQRPSYDLLARFWNVLNIHLSNSHRVSRDALRALLFAVCSSVGPLPRLDRLLFCPHQLPNTDLIHYANEFTSGFRRGFARVSWSGAPSDQAAPPSCARVFCAAPWSH